MALQPDAKTDIDRTTSAPFLLRLFWRQNRQLDPWEFSVAPPNDTTGIPDYASLLPSNIRSQSLQIYTWPNCTLGELTSLFLPILPPNVLPSPAVGTRLVYKLIFPDTRATLVEGGRGKWIDKPLGSVVIGGNASELQDDENGDAMDVENFEGDSQKTLAEARFVIGDYVAVSIYPPGPDGRVAALPPPSSRGPPRDGMRGPPPPRENGYGRGGYRGGYSGGGYDSGYGGGGYGGGGYGGGYRGRGGGGFGAAPPPGDWRRGERPPGGYEGGRGGYRGRGGRPY